MIPKALIIGIFLIALLHEVQCQGTGVTPDPAMDTCTGAAGPRPANGVFSPGNTETQTVDDVNGGFCGVEINTPGIWWWVNGTGNILRAATCDERTAIKVKISVFTGTCDALRCVTGGASPNFECPIVQRKESGEWDTVATAIDFFTVLGQHYYLLVQEVNQSGTVWLNFNIPTYPRNNECINAVGPLPRDNTMVLSTTTNAAISDVPEGYCGAPPLYPGVWFQFFGTGGDVTLAACGEFNFDGIYFSVYQGASCDDKVCADGSYEVAVSDSEKCSFGAADALRPMTTYTLPTKDRDRYYVYVHWGRTAGDQATGDFRLYLDDGKGGAAGSGGATVIKFAPSSGVTDDKGNDSNGDGSKDKDSDDKKSGTLPLRNASCLAMAIILVLVRCWS